MYWFHSDITLMMFQSEWSIAMQEKERKREKKKFTSFWEEPSKYRQFIYSHMWRSKRESRITAKRTKKVLYDEEQLIRGEHQPSYCVSFHPNIIIKTISLRKIIRIFWEQKSVLLMLSMRFYCICVPWSVFYEHSYLQLYNFVTFFLSRSTLQRMKSQRGEERLKAEQ